MKSISGKAFCSVLERNGWKLIRVRGSHHVFASPDGHNMTVVPVHENHDLKDGLLKHLLKHTGISLKNI